MNATETKADPTETELVSENEFGLQLRHAATARDWWPGYDPESMPLGTRGYWMGDHRRHTWVGANRAEVMNEWQFINDSGMARITFTA